MGKYDAVIAAKKLKPVPVEDPRHQEKVNKKKDEIRARLAAENVPVNARTIAEAYSLARFQKNELEEELKPVNLEIAALEQMLFKSQENMDEGWGEFGAKDNMVRLVTGSSVSIQKEPTGKIIDRYQYRQWCIDNGLENELQLHPSTTQSLLKDRLLKNLGEPDGMEVYFRPKFVFRR
jgi:hypothetical protein